MFSVTLVQLKQIANSIGEGFHQFSDGDQVWRGDDGSLLIGTQEALERAIEAGEADDIYVSAGTVGEYATPAMP